MEFHDRFCSRKIAAHSASRIAVVELESAANMTLPGRKNLTALTVIHQNGGGVSLRLNSQLEVSMKYRVLMNSYEFWARSAGAGTQSFGRHHCRDVEIEKLLEPAPSIGARLTSLTMGG